jgi:hypothetical protein
MAGIFLAEKLGSVGLIQIMVGCFEQRKLNILALCQFT